MISGWAKSGGAGAQRSKPSAPKQEGEHIRVYETLSLPQPSICFWSQNVYLSSQVLPVLLPKL